MTVPIADLRRDPDHRSELVSQGLFGEAFRVLAVSPDGRWLRVRGEEDGYAGWARTWSVALGSPAAGTRWRSAARWLVRRPWLSPAGGEGALPWGSRVVRVGRSLFGPLGVLGPAPRTGTVLLPRGAKAGPGALGRAIVATARGMQGVPYHWGGRTFAGVDCSGLVQLSARPHGLRLPRDARDQCAAVGGPTRLRPFAAALLPGPEGIRAGDLWFFGPNRREVTHVALSTGGLGLLHAYGRVRTGSLDPGSPSFEPELFRYSLGWQALARVPRSLFDR